ncbi:MAG: FMN-binding negative transcriptional regulator, partial [Gammaproteobacteria bacterium]|nr:FMN-binding negative transcriptional regulator [Gammaproteobacteria bacterium]
ETYGVVEGLSQKHESRFERPWHPASMNQDILRSMLGAIVGFKINITEIQAKAKLSQNRSKNDQASAIDGLRESGSEQELEIATLMRVNLNK